MDSDIDALQKKYLLSGLFVLPFAPFLYLQGRYARYRVGRLPDAAGDSTGVFEGNGRSVRLLAIGESTVAGVGVTELKDALGGRFAFHLSRETGANVHWHALGVSGITVKRTLEEIVPEVPADPFDLILIALGGNDVFALNSPVRFRDDMSELIRRLRESSPGAGIVLANVPMVRDAIGLPHPLKYVLAKLAKVQHFNSIGFASEMKDVYYYDEVKKVGDEFFSDGVHPSGSGYDSWAEDIVRCYLKRTNGLRSG
ncbi:MAG TPA: SGNH/GDSL hydrolase family protein [Aridibacter sp.]|nr:SGNH/GDSL hydrolase family protein [Aridibacter sp.]